MDRIGFEWVETGYGAGRFPGLVVSVNDQPLTAWLGRWTGDERAWAPLLDDVGWPRRHFLGEPVLDAGGRTVVLGCTCGDWECGWVDVVVDVDDDRVRWSGFRAGFQRYDLDDVPPLTFARADYEAAVRGTAR